MLRQILENTRKRAPLIHNITNYVTVNDVANMLLACGASPIMADDIHEAADIASICDGLCINLGTLNSRTISSMLLAGTAANRKGSTVVFDPVGAGASMYRTQTANSLLSEVRFSVIRGNISEIKALALGSGGARGVDADVADAVSEGNLDGAVRFAKGFSQKTGAVVAITGEIDIVANPATAYCVYNGHPMMSRVTGTGCQLSALVAALAAANPQETLLAAAAAVCAMGLCGEIAYGRLTPQDGNMAYRNHIIDAMFRLTGDALEEGAKYETR